MVQLTHSIRTPLVAHASDRHADEPLVWGLTPQELHDAFWRSKGVQCVRRGQHQRLQRAAELFLLIEPEQLVLFNIARLSERLTWCDAAVTRVRLVSHERQCYSEHVVTDDRGIVQRIERRYSPAVEPSARVMITSFRRIAASWMSARSRREGVHRVRRLVVWNRVDHCTSPGCAFQQGDLQQQTAMLNELVRIWPCPSQAIDGLVQAEPGVWHATGESLALGAVRVGPLWMGRGSGLSQKTCMIGPAWTADQSQPDAAPSVVIIRDISEVELPQTSSGNPSHRSARLYPVIKRALDVAGSLAALLLCLPIMLLVAACILTEDGRPLVFGHSRQGRDGRIFRCWKFRTMHRNAHKVVRDLAVKNECDGPQVFIRNDPRVTRVGRFLRAANLDELPQFWNVLAGHLSLVGPRPSPDDENQFCPAWRDRRLSVRPGITGLWQLNRTRKRGADFQEWIKYDIQYVQHASLWLDLKLLLRTATLLATGRS